MKYWQILLLVGGTLLLGSSTSFVEANEVTEPQTEYGGSPPPGGGNMGPMGNSSCQPPMPDPETLEVNMDGFKECITKEMTESMPPELLALPNGTAVVDYMKESISEMVDEMMEAALNNETFDQESYERKMTEDVFSMLGIDEEMLAEIMKGNGTLPPGLMPGTDGSSETTSASGTENESGSSGSAESTGATETENSSDASGSSGTTGEAETENSSDASGSSGTTGEAETENSSDASGSSGTTGEAETENSSDASGSSGTTGEAETENSSDASGSSGTTGEAETENSSDASGSSGTTGEAETENSSGSSGASGTTDEAETENSSDASGSSGTTGEAEIENSSGSSGNTGASETENSSGSSGSSGATGEAETENSSGSSGNTDASESENSSDSSGNTGASETANSSGSSDSSGAAGTENTQGTSGTPTSKYANILSEGNTEYYQDGLLAVLRYTISTSEEEAKLYLNPSNENYIAEKKVVDELGETLGEVTLLRKFRLNTIITTKSNEVTCEIDGKINGEDDIEKLKAYFASTDHYGKFQNKKWSIGKEIVKNRVTMLDVKLQTPFDEKLNDRSSAEYASVLQQLNYYGNELKKKYPKVESLLALRIYKGSTGIQTAVYTDSSSTDTTTADVQNSAAEITSVNGVDVSTTPSESTLVTMTDAETSGAVNGDVPDETLLDDQYGVNTQVKSEANPDSEVISMDLFLNITVPGLLAMTMAIVCICCCVANRNSFICKMCDSNMKADPEANH